MSLCEQKSPLGIGEGKRIWGVISHPLAIDRELAQEFLREISKDPLMSELVMAASAGRLAQEIRRRIDHLGGPEKLQAGKDGWDARN